MNKIEAYRHYYSIYHGFELKPDVNLPYTRITTENGVLYFAEFLMLLNMRGDLDDLDRARFYKLARDLQVMPGLFDRGAGESRTVPYQERRSISHDNIDGISAASMLCKYSFHNDIAHYGLKNCFIYNNIKPRSVFPENPSNYSYWLQAADMPILAFLFLPFLMLSQFITLLKSKENTSGKKLDILMLYSINNKYKNSFIFKFIAKRYFNSLSRKYGENFLEKIYAIYYPEGHPVLEFSRGIVYRDNNFVLEV